jgi:hypothetical protein
MTHQQRKINLYHSIKKAINSGWTVPLSSDGYANYGTGDQITSDGYGANGFGNPAAWCIINKVINAQQYQFCLQNDGYMGLRVKYSKLGFDSGTGDLLQVPSATDEDVVIGSGTNTTPVYQQFISGVLNFNVRGVVIFLHTATNRINITLTPPMPRPPPQPAPTPIINKVLT